MGFTRSSIAVAAGGGLALAALLWWRRRSRSMQASEKGQSARGPVAHKIEHTVIFGAVEGEVTQHASIYVPRRVSCRGQANLSHARTHPPDQERGGNAMPNTKALVDPYFWVSRVPPWACLAWPGLAWHGMAWRPLLFTDRTWPCSGK